MVKHGLAAAIAILCCTSALGQGEGNATRGRMFAETNCAPCHAVGLQGASPYAPAPPFRTLHTRYPVDSLAEALAEGIGVGHTGVRQMPEFVLTVQEIEDLLAYLKTLEPR